VTLAVIDFEIEVRMREDQSLEWLMHHVATSYAAAPKLPCGMLPMVMSTGVLSTGCAIELRGGESSHRE
jgi:hypothetical protein